MTETRTIRDPFLNKEVEISSKLTDRLRGRYAVGPTLPNGDPEFGWREFDVPPIQKEAADVIERQRKALDWIAERSLDAWAVGVAMEILGHGPRDRSLDPPAQTSAE